MMNGSLSWPWQWNWFGLNKKKHKTSEVASRTMKAMRYGPDEEIPGSVYAGGAEILAGCLGFILGTVFPPAYGVGIALIADGINRTINGCNELSEQRKHYSDPLPTSINF